MATRECKLLSIFNLQFQLTLEKCRVSLRMCLKLTLLERQNLVLDV